MKLTNESIESIRGDGRDRVIVDDVLPGFILRIRKSGRKFYAIQYRMHGKLYRVKIGRVEAYSAEKARKKARVMLGKVADGVNVAKARDAERQGPTCDEVFEAFCAARKSAGEWFGRTESKYRGDWRLHLAPRLGGMPVELVSARDVQTIKTACGDRLGAAGSALRLLRAVLNFAERKRLRPRGENPIVSEDLYRSPRRDTRLSFDEYARLGAELAGAEERGDVSPFAALAIRLLALSGARKLEICAARWAWYDAKAGALRLPESKTGPRLVVLPATARALLEAAPRLESNEFIIAGFRQGQRGGTIDRAFYRIRAAAGLQHVRIHDLRHGWATAASELGIAYPIVATALGHRLQGMTGAYVHVSASALRGPVDTVGAWIAGALAGETSKVVAFASR